MQMRTDRIESQGDTTKVFEPGEMGVVGVVAVGMSVSSCSN